MFIKPTIIIFPEEAAMIKSKSILSLPEAKGHLYENRDFLKDLLSEVTELLLVTPQFVLIFFRYPNGFHMLLYQ